METTLTSIAAAVFAWPYPPMRNEVVSIDDPGRELTALQRSFADAFVTYRSLSRAYAASAYKSDGLNIMAIHRRARAVMAVPHVRAYVEDRINDAAGDAVFTAQEALGRYLAIAAADPNELVSVRTGACRYCHGVAFGYQWRPSEYLAALSAAERNGRPLPEPMGGLSFNATLPPHPDCPECDGEGVASVIVHDTETLSPGGQLLYGGAKVNKAGNVEIIVADRHKALEMASRIIGALKPENGGINLTVNGVANMADNINLAKIDPTQARKAYMDMIAVDGGVKPTYVFEPEEGEEANVRSENGHPSPEATGGPQGEIADD